MENWINNWKKWLEKPLIKRLKIKIYVAEDLDKYAAEKTFHGYGFGGMMVI